MNYKIYIFLVLFCSLKTLKAQTNIPVSKPKIGLVLSGGGAKGLAHIGTLKVIDSLGLKIDYIAGTSIGAIIGGLYASGYSGKELEYMFKQTDFDKIISDEIPRSSIAFAERDNKEKYALKLPFEEFKIKLPSALSRGHNSRFVLSRALLHVNTITDFSKLPIPFFCIATNVEHGSQVILDHGNLVQSIMASGTLPSLFQPLTIGEDLLIDGGVINNYPIDELKSKGMDLIIGVDVQDGLATREELTSAPEVLLQINNFKTINDMKQKVKKTDVYIKPLIKDFTVVSFSELEAIISAGEKATLLKVSTLSNLAKQNPLTQKKNTVKLLDSINLNEIYLEGHKNYSRSYILGKLKFNNHEKISYTDFKKGLDNLIATNNFESFNYELKSTAIENIYNLHAKIKEAKINTYFKASFHYDRLYKSSLVLNLTKKNTLLKIDKASLDFIIGDNMRYNFEYSLDQGSSWSLIFKSRYNRFGRNINATLLLNENQTQAIGLKEINIKLHDITNQLNLQTLFRKDFSLTVGLEHKYLKINSNTIFGRNPDEAYLVDNTDYFSLHGNLKLDTYDNKYFPKKGVYINGNLNLYPFVLGFAEPSFDNFSIAKANLGYAFSLTNKLSFNIESSGGFKLGDKSNSSLNFALGGYGNDFINNYVPFVGYDFLSLFGNSYVKSNVLADYEIFPKQHITLEGNWSNIADNIFDSGEWFTLPDYSGYGIGYGVETFFGPIQAKYSISPEQKKGVWFFNIGYWF